ncbi:TRAP transporter large permease [Amorphus coralli]|uniref:TRAP transporter large permease n=1 Tax=Amorphus coralli TaxID=340680 RepID=UPI000363AEBD|nr:TRAP transporter large permease subunit [Amorphus coralli]
MTQEVVFVALMFAVFAGGLFAGFPVAFVLGGTGILFAVLGDLLPMVGIKVMAGTNFIGFSSDRIFGSLSNYSLVPIAMFVFMGLMLERSGVAGRLLAAMSRVMRSVPGGLGLSVVLIGLVLAASTGIIGASVVLLATVALPALRKAGYDIPLSLGTVAASGCLGILIPPSIMLIVMGDQLRLSVGDLFMAAVVPGVILSVLYSLYIVILCALRPDMAPKLPPEPDRNGEGSAILELVRALVPPMALMAAVLGSIFLGIASPTEASGVGALGATLLAAADRRLTWETLKDVCHGTGKTTAFLFALIFGASCFSVVLRGYGGDEVIEGAITGLPFPPEAVLGMVLLVVFLLGFVLDWMEIVLIIAPLTVPVVVGLGFDPLWVAILIAICLQTSFLTPPVGMALFYVKSAAPPDVKTVQIYRGIVPFVILQLVGLIAVWLIPDLALHLPRIAY